MSNRITITNFMKGRIKRSTLIDYVEKKLIEQGCQSKNGNTCAYRGPDGTKCAIGHIVPDSRYRAEMDRDPCLVDDLLYRYAPELGVDQDIFDLCDMNMLSDMQNVHDEYTPTDGSFTEWVERRFDRIRREYPDNK